MLSMLHHSRVLMDRTESLFPASKENSSSPLRESFETGAVEKDGQPNQTIRSSSTRRETINQLCDDVPEVGRRAAGGGSSARESYDEI